MKGLAAFASKTDKGASSPVDETEEEAPESVDEPKVDTEIAYANEAFDALKDGDRDGFASAFLDAVRSCVKKSKAGTYK